MDNKRDSAQMEQVLRKLISEGLEEAGIELNPSMGNEPDPSAKIIENLYDSIRLALIAKDDTIKYTKALYTTLVAASLGEKEEPRGNLFEITRDIQELSREIVLSSKAKATVIASKYDIKAAPVLEAAFAKSIEKLLISNDKKKPVDPKAQRLEEIEKLKGTIPDEFYEVLKNKYE